MKTIVITGATGLLGTRIQELLSDSFTFIPLSSIDIDVTNIDSVTSALRSLSFDTILHLAGYTNVDKAEQEEERAFLVNEAGTKNLVTVANTYKKDFIYISTDFVFDGISPPFTENSKPHPLSVYGNSKYKGEVHVDNNGMIVRISYPYRSYFAKKSDIFRTIFTRLRNKEKLYMITDSLIVPTFIDDIAYALRHLILHFSPEIFHIVGKTALSPYDVSILISKMFHFNPSYIVKTTYDSFFNNKARRPQYSDIQTTKNSFYSMKPFDEGLSIIKKQLNIL